MNFRRTEGCDVGYILFASSIPAAAVVVAHFIAPKIICRAVAVRVSSNNEAF